MAGSHHNHNIDDDGCCCSSFVVAVYVVGCCIGFFMNWYAFQYRKKASQYGNKKRWVHPIILLQILWPIWKDRGSNDGIIEHLLTVCGPNVRQDWWLWLWSLVWWWLWFRGSYYGGSLDLCHRGRATVGIATNDYQQESIVSKDFYNTNFIILSGKSNKVYLFWINLHKLNFSDCFCAQRNK